MGCFSYICPKCNNPIYADKYGNCIGEEVRLARLVKGKVVEWMLGRYDSYGKVHVAEKDAVAQFSEHWIGDVKIFNEQETHEWLTAEWSTLVAEHLSPDDYTGTIAIHDKCWDGEFGNIKSKDDPDQGWNDYESSEKSPMMEAKEELLKNLRSKNDIEIR